MSICYCGQVEIPLGITMCKDPRPQHHVVHGVTACVSAGTDWEKRAKQAEAEVERLTAALAERDLCDACNGTGQWVDYPAVACPKCHGCPRCSRGES